VMESNACVSTSMSVPTAWSFPIGFVVIILVAVLVACGWSNKVGISYGCCPPVRPPITHLLLLIHSGRALPFFLHCCLSF
jgi:hypothetical protein